MMSFSSSSPSPSPESSEYKTDVRRVYSMPFHVTVSTCGTIPAGMPPSTPICVYESERKNSMRSFTSAMAPARDLLFVTTSSENWNAAAMPRKTTSMSAVPTTVSRSVTPRSPSLRGILNASDVLRQLIDGRYHRNREETDRGSDEYHEERLDGGRHVFRFPVNLILIEKREPL